MPSDGGGGGRGGGGGGPLNGFLLGGENSSGPLRSGWLRNEISLSDDHDEMWADGQKRTFPENFLEIRGCATRNSFWKLGGGPGEIYA